MLHELSFKKASLSEGIPNNDIRYTDTPKHLTSNALLQKTILKNQEQIQAFSVVAITDAEVGCITRRSQFLVKFRFSFVMDQSRRDAAVDLVVIWCRLGPPCTICTQAFDAGGRSRAPSSHQWPEPGDCNLVHAWSFFYNS